MGSKLLLLLIGVGVLILVFFITKSRDNSN